MSRQTPLIVAVLAVLLSGCAPAVADPPTPAASVTDRSSPSSEPAPGVTSPEATATAETRTQVPTTAPTAQPLVLGGTWVKPGAGATLSSYTTTLSAKPTAAGDGVTTFTRVVFSATWPGGEKTVACKATRPGKNGAWHCTADLLALGIPPGKVTFSFDVVGEGVPIARSPDGLRQVTYAVAPPRPTNTRLQQLEQPDLEGGDNSAILHRVRWSAPAGYAGEFLVYETFECPRASTRETNGEPCFVAGTPVDASQLELRATASGDTRSVRIRLTEFECGPSHGTILLRARNSFGQSVFAIVEAAPIVWVAPDEVFC
jgi:hypothetical protein